MTLQDKTLFISGGSRGIGLEIALRAARDGASVAVITRPSRECTANALLCEDVLAEEGVTDMDAHAHVPGAALQVDLFVDHV
jgi:citronellol/citronellal dehydrogenase